MLCLHTMIVWDIIRFYLKVHRLPLVLRRLVVHSMHWSKTALLSMHRSKKQNLGCQKKGWVLVCFQSNQTTEEVIFRKINMEQFLSQRYCLNCWNVQKYYLKVWISYLLCKFCMILMSADASNDPSITCGR